jgi:integrase
MASVSIRARTLDGRQRRWIVDYRLGGSETQPKHGGSFKTKAEAVARRNYIASELAAMRIPNLTLVEPAQPKAPTLREVGDAWLASRVDVGVQTAKNHRADLNRIGTVMPELFDKRIDAVTVEELVALVSALAAQTKKSGEKKYKRDTIGKTVDAVAMTFTYHGIDPNPARDKRVKLPYEKKTHVPPPLAEHVERVAEHLPRHHVLPLLVIDQCGPRVNELATAQVGDLDEHRRAIRVRSENEKNERYRLLELPDDLFDALLATLPRREDRNLDAPLFPDLTDARLRTAISKACQATGTPHFSPHGLRRRRGSLHYKSTGSLAEVAELLGDSKRVASEHYVYAMTDYGEVDRSIALARAAMAAV